MRSLAIILMAATGVSLLPAQQKQRAKQEAKLAKELESGWHQWLIEDVAWIITDEERKAFNQLGTDDEREQFVEQFWLRRDPTPDTVENEYKEEHYRRIAYANEHFASGIPGWKTDRGRIYIRFGAPDEIESHPSGGSYQRPAAQGGGQTSTYPFEQWRYRHLDDIGEDIVVEFVDASMSGEYRMTSDPCEKDALTYVPGAGPTQAEQMGLSTRNARFQNTDGTHCGAPLGGKPANDNEFSRLELQSKLDKAPAIKFRDLEAVVNSRISYNALPMKVEVDYLRVTDFSVIVNVTMQFENRDLQFLSKDGVEKSTIELLGRVNTMTGRRSTGFERSLETIAPPGMIEQYAKQRAIYQEMLPLAPGRYKMSIVARDKVSGNITNYEVALDVPRFEEGKLAASSLILADEIGPLPTKSVGGGVFAIGETRVRPRVDRQFTAAEKMGIYLQVYNLAPESNLSWEVDKAGTGEKALEFSEALAAAPQTKIERLLSLQKLAPGAYRLKLKVAGGAEAVERQAEFTIKP